MIFAVVYEAVASLWTSRGRTLVQLSMVTLVICAIGTIEGIVAHKASTEYTNALAAGSEVVVATSDNSVGLSAAACSLLGRSSGVVASGGFKVGGVAHSASAPGIAFQTVGVTSRYLEVVSVNPSTRPPVETQPASTLGSALARDIAVTAGTRLVMTNGEQSEVSSIVDTSARAPDQSRWVFSHRLLSTVDQCWVEAVPGARGPVLDIVRSALTSDTTRATVSPLRARDSRSEIEGWHDRPTRLGWAWGGIAVSMLVSLALIGRRSEFALRRSLGFNRLHLVFQLILEYAVVILVASLLALLWLHTALAAANAGSDAAYYYAHRSVALAATTSLALTPAVALLATHLNLAGALRER